MGNIAKSSPSASFGSHWCGIVSTWGRRGRGRKNSRRRKIIRGGRGGRGHEDWGLGRGRGDEVLFIKNKEVIWMTIDLTFITLK